MRGGFALALAAAIARPGVARADGEIDRAEQLYADGEQALAAGDATGAVADFGEAYALTADPALLFKLGNARAKLGDCAAAVADYRRYLAQGAPEPRFAALTEQRIAACPIAAPAPVVEPPVRHGNNAAWIVGGTSAAFVTLGIVLAFAARSSQDDIRDLYAPLGTAPAVYNTATAERYHQLINEGHNYEHLSWAAFGVAAATAAGAALLFTYGRHTIEITPQPTGAAASVSF